MDSKTLVTKDADVAVMVLQEGNAVTLDLTGMPREQSDALWLEFRQKYDKMIAKARSVNPPWQNR